VDGSGRIGNVSGSLVLGGASAHRGRDPAHLTLGGVAVATRIARTLAELFEEVLLVGGDPPPDAPGRRVADLDGPRCALRGLASALAAAGAERVLIVATDLPLVTPELLLALVAWPEADAVVPRTAERSHPLCALYRRERVLPLARERLAAGRLAVHDLLEGLETAYLEAEDLKRLDPDGDALSPMNTPDERARLEARLAGRA
jgi:molybdopterin-guanine dinucleotide biosynthesis protein A